MPQTLVVAIAGPLVVLRQLGQSLARLLPRGKTLAGELTSSVIKELTDPVRFVIGAFFIAFSPERDKSWFLRTLFAVLVLVAAAAPPLAGGLVKGTGDPLVYAAAGFTAGIFTLIPDRVAELREHKKIREGKYPIKIKTFLVGVEYVIVFLVVVLAAVPFLGGPLDHMFWRGVAWGVGTVALADLVTVNGCVLIGGAGVILNLTANARAASEELTQNASAGESATQPSGKVARARQALLDVVEPPATAPDPEAPPMMGVAGVPA
jgi:hypothetical protein